MDDSQLCGRPGLSGGAGDRRCDWLGEPRRPCERDHCVVLPCILDPFGGPCAPVAETAALTLSGSVALASLASADARSYSGPACARSPEGELEDVKVVPNGPFATWKYSEASPQVAKYSKTQQSVCSVTAIRTSGTMA